MSFEIGAKVTNSQGAWAVLRTAPNRTNSLATVYFVECYAPDFPEHITSTEMAHNQHRARAEKAMRTWLAKR